VIVPEELRGDALLVSPAVGPTARTLGDLKEFGEVVRLVEDRDKIAAIKLLRRTTELGLKDAKTVVDRIAAGGIAEVAGYPIRPSQPPLQPPSPDRAEQIARIGRLLRGGNKIEAIRVYRETFGVGLKEAKDAVERLETTADTPGAFDLHPPEAASTALPVTSTPTEVGPARSSRLGCVIGLIAIAAVAALLWFAYSAYSDSRFAVSIQRQLTIEAPTATFPPAPTQVPPVPTITPAPTPWFYSPSILVACSGVERGCFEVATSIGVDGAGNIYVGEYVGGRVQVFDPAGEFITQWRIGGEDVVLHHMAVDREGVVYAVSDGNIYRYEGATGHLLGQMEYSGGQGFQDVAVAPDGGLVASWNRDWQGGLFVNFDESQDDIVVFDSAGRVASVIAKALSEAGGGDPELETVIAVDREGTIYASGLLNPAVYKFAPDGEFAGELGEGEVTDVDALAVDEQGRVYVATSGDIRVFAPDGRYLGLIDWSPNDMVFTDQNELLIIDNPQVIRFVLDWE
jgi:ribosomal protein L7/L12/sugar lactone lactonase YvrE